ncbi:unnamed protein product [Tilletia laevis]|uniref:Major facilitator superfamily (MFS) profile domain-containing protein n=2 Tax=Tilletia TaxID=13289 RepID=A0A177VHG2_9BASI|nr:hypothetical protein CF336_g622 [Tilletia laevis]KAE8263137.1 hypothetical protein A4X03_0g1905 [Tilletia caries]KAE8206704.1 hypothetical protein CF335_g1678 [Tilletia laevis]CAD6885207.1 unnamed protein product [Tilletia caries]CAD6919929.1 unnamed protein product [Tilletia caries]
MSTISGVNNSMSASTAKVVDVLEVPDKPELGRFESESRKGTTLEAGADALSAKPAFALLAEEIQGSLRKTEGFDAELTWTRREERWVTVKTDLCVLIPVFLVFVFLALDRSNVANALTDNFLKDLHITQNELNNAVLLGNAAIGLFDIPSNILAKRFGPNRYLPLLVLAWGAVTVGQAFITNKAQLYVCRFLVGAFEAGAIPGYAYYLLRFYRDREIASRYAYFWSANIFASAIGGLLSLGILKLRGTHGRAGWSYLFIIYGTITIAVALFALAWLPDSAVSASRGTFARLWYTPRQASILTTRVLLDDPEKSEEIHAAPLSRAEIFVTLTDWRLWTLVLCAAATAVLYSPINTYSLLLIKSLGFRGYTANGLAVPGFVLSIVWSIVMGILINRHGRHAFYVAITNIGAVIGLLWISLVPRNKAAQYIGILWLLTFNISAVGVIGAWTAHVVPARQRAVALALTVSFNNLASLGGSQVLRSSDAPRYKHGLWALSGTCTAGAILAGVAHLALRHRRRGR